MDIFRLESFAFACPSRGLFDEEIKEPYSPLTAGGVYDDGLLAGEGSRTLTARLAERNDGSEALRPLTASGLSSSSSSSSSSPLRPPLFPPQPTLCGFGLVVPPTLCVSRWLNVQSVGNRVPFLIASDVVLLTSAGGGPKPVYRVHSSAHPISEAATIKTE